MELEATLCTLECLDENIASLYTAVTDGDKTSYRINIKGGYKTEDEVQKLHRTVDATRRERDEYERKLKETESQAREAFAKLDEISSQPKNSLPELDLEKEFQARLPGIVDPLNKQIEEAKAAQARAESERDNILVDNSIQASLFVKEKISSDPAHQMLVKSELKRHLKVENGKVIPCEIDFDGTLKPIFDINGRIAPLDEAFKKIVEGWPIAQSVLAGANMSGAGSVSGGASIAPTMNPWKKEQWNVTEQHRMLSAHPDLAKSLQAQAGIR